MTAEPVIADGVVEMHAARAKEPLNEAMVAFSREQAALAAAGVPAGLPDPARRSGMPICLTRTGRRPARPSTPTAPPAC
jgi:hypothetical protein